MLAAEGPTKNLGCVMCGQPGVVLPGLADVAGEYTAWFCYAGTEVAITFELEEGAPMVVPLGTLGAPYTYAFHVELPDGAGVWSTEIDGVEFQRWIVCLKVPLVGEPVLLDMESVTCENLTDPEKGLTEAQVFTCIVPLLDFSDDEMWASLSVEQLAQIVARLPGSGVDYIAQTYATIAAAAADNTTIVAVGRAIVVDGRLYQGTGSVASALVADGVFNPSFKEIGDLTLITTVDGIPASVQIQTP